jgi:hypothetical protein
VLHGAHFKADANLLNFLMQRVELGAEIKSLKLFGCMSLYRLQVEALKRVVRLKWD